MAKKATALTPGPVAKMKASVVKKSPSKVKKPVAKKAVKVNKAKPKSAAFMDRVSYKAAIQGLLDQGLDREDAVLTLKVGIRQANGLPVSQELLSQCASNPYTAHTEELETV